MRMIRAVPFLMAATVLAAAPSVTRAQEGAGGAGTRPAHATRPADAPADPRYAPGAVAPVLEGVGNAHLVISTTVPRAQQFFDQGLRLSYAFNHPEAVRAFKEAQRVDPKCGMCWWGEALVLGPNINMASPSPEAEKQAYDAAQQALKRRKTATPKERALIDAIATRYTKGVVDRPALDKAYAKAMTGVASTYRDDLDVQTLYAESLMDLSPWDFWTNAGQPTTYTETIVGVLDEVLAKDPNHAGADHFLIHVMEASKTPEKALAAADRLSTLAPSAGHMVHMPAHIYMRTGFYEKAAASNVRAIAADESYIEQCRAQGAYPLYLYPHNMHFLWAASTFEGNSALAIATAHKMTGKLTHDHTAGPASVQDWAVVPFYALVRFGRWDDVLAEKTISDKPYANAIRHWARGLAFANRGQLDAAREELKQFETEQASPELQKDSVGFDPAPRVLEIPRKTLQADIARAEHKRADQIRLLQEAVAIQDGLRYNEPPEWHQPVRHLLGAALLDEGRGAEAEAVYRKDLEENRENGWALFGLLQSLRAQGKVGEAAEVEARFRRAWARADIILTGSRF
jgi:tetratricopeptide (TPR) repeat protein